VTEGSQDRLRVRALSGNNLGQVVDTHVPLFTKQYNLVRVKGRWCPEAGEGNRRSGVALAMRHGLKWFIHLRAQWPRVGDEHLTYAPAGARLGLPFVAVIVMMMMMSAMVIIMFFVEMPFHCWNQQCFGSPVMKKIIYLLQHLEQRSPRNYFVSPFIPHSSLYWRRAVVLHQPMALQVKKMGRTQKLHFLTDTANFGQNFDSQPANFQQGAERFNFAPKFL